MAMKTRKYMLDFQYKIPGGEWKMKQIFFRESTIERARKRINTIWMYFVRQKSASIGVEYMDVMNVGLKKVKREYN